MAAVMGPETYEDTLARFLWACMVLGVMVVIPCALLHYFNVLMREWTIDCNRVWGVCWRLLHLEGGELW
jgi:hypothetical protein